ncbi:MAG: Hg(II)-responsive transcriptional regulator [Gammaproteobacteria bacterium]|nr:MAG: Hg(II)-responsive transcriptional regulator [Gammaproteobacteria bacterium]
MSGEIKTLTIGRLARKAGVNLETIRYYQRVGIISEPAKPLQGYRQYPADTIDRIHFIKRSQQLGFSLQEIAELLQLGDGHCSDVRQRAIHKRDTIVQQIADLNALKDTLENLISACGSGGQAHCPIVETLASRH